MSAEAKRGISESTLKIIAAVAMLADHTAVMLAEDCVTQAGLEVALLPGLGMLISGKLFAFPAGVPLYFIGRLIGRISFPIFAYLITEGFKYTHNVKKYALRLAVFAVISEVPFNLVSCGEPFGLAHQNVFFTLLFGLLAMVGMRSIKPAFAKFIPVAVFAVAAQFFNTDYGAYGVVIIILFYVLAERRLARNVVCGTALLMQLTAPVSLVFINMSNGKRGLSLKYAFYIFYPAHLLILYLISTAK